MPFISSTLAIAMLVVIVLTALGVAWWKKDYGTYDKDSFHSFVAILSGLGIFITFAFYYNLISLQEQQQELIEIQETSRISDIMLNSVLDTMNAASLIIPSFVLSMTPLTNTICCPGGTTGPPSCQYTPVTDPVTPQTCQEKAALSFRIFSLWQDTVVSNMIDTNNQFTYVTNFLQRANSTQLHEQWEVSKLNFGPKTQIYGDLLFEYGLPITDQVPESYISAANALMSDPRYSEVFGPGSAPTQHVF